MLESPAKRSRTNNNSGNFKVNNRFHKPICPCLRLYVHCPPVNISFLSTFKNKGPYKNILSKNSSGSFCNFNCLYIFMNLSFNDGRNTNISLFPCCHNDRKQAIPNCQMPICDVLWSICPCYLRYRLPNSTHRTVSTPRWTHQRHSGSGRTRTDAHTWTKVNYFIQILWWGGGGW